MPPVQIGVGYLINIAEAGYRLVSNRGTALLLVTAASCLAWITRAAPDHGHNAAIMAAVFVASLVGSIAGFAFSAVAGGMLFHLQDEPVHIVAIMITCSIANQAKMTWALRHSIEWRHLWRYFAGGAPGLAIGIWLLLHADRTVYTHLLGGFLCGLWRLHAVAQAGRDPPSAGRGRYRHRVPGGRHRGGRLGFQGRSSPSGAA